MSNAPSPGDRVQHRRLFRSASDWPPVRLGAAEPKTVIAVTGEYVIYRTESSQGRDLGETVVTLDEFRNELEIVGDRADLHGEEK